MKLPLDLFLMMKKNYFIEQMEKTEAGRKYLADCARLSNTKLDIYGLRKRFALDKA